MNFELDRATSASEPSRLTRSRMLRPPGESSLEIDFMQSCKFGVGFVVTSPIERTIKRKVVAFIIIK